MRAEIAQYVSELTEELIAVRRDLHRHPELAFKEERTAGLVARRLRELGLKVKTGVAGTGVVGLLEGSQPGPTVMFRLDMDALPIQEPQDRPYSSQNPGVMHACGHDGHTAVGLAVASILARYRHSIKGRVKLVFQPAEEIIAGAARMVEEGVMRDPPVDRVLSVHVWPGLPVGTIGVRAGPIFASVDEIALTIEGRGGHGGMPHLSVDAIAIAAQVHSTLQLIMGREVAPSQPAVLGFGTIHGGTQFNVICERVEMRGNVRCFDEQVRSQMLGRVREIASAVVTGLRGRLEFQHVRGCPAVVNDPEVAQRVAEVGAGVVGEGNVVQVDPQPVGDDCAYFLKEAPGCYFLLGIANPDRGITEPLHSPRFDLDEAALPIATHVLAETALSYLA